MFDIWSADAAERARVPDEVVLARTAETGYVLVSHDYRTMPSHFADLLASGHHRPGVLLLHQQLPIAQAIEALLLVWDASEPEDWLDQLTYLPL